jgi:hypothetical protein
MKKKVIRTILCGFLGALAIFCYAGSAVMQDYTLAQWWVLPGVAFLISAVSACWGWQMWRWLSEINNVVVNVIIHIVFFTGFLSAMFYGSNMLWADSAAAYDADAVVVEKYTKMRQPVQRSGRRTYTHGRPYRVYFITLRLSDGRVKDRELSRKKYSRVHAGDTLTLRLEKGLWGIPVVADTHKK